MFAENSLVVKPYEETIIVLINVNPILFYNIKTIPVQKHQFDQELPDPNLIIVVIINDI